MRPRRLICSGGPTSHLTASQTFTWFDQIWRIRDSPGNRSSTTHSVDVSDGADRRACGRPIVKQASWTGPLFPACLLWSLPNVNANVSGLPRFFSPILFLASRSYRQHIVKSAGSPRRALAASPRSQRLPPQNLLPTPVKRSRLYARPS